MNNLQTQARRAVFGMPCTSDERDWVLAIEPGSRLSESKSPFQDWDQDFEKPFPFFETGIKTFKLPILFSRLEWRLTN